MRVTDGMRYGSVLRNLSGLTARHTKVSEQAVTGSRIGAPSDDPLAAAELTRVHSSITQLDTQRKALNGARSDVELAEGVLAEISTLFQRAHELAVQGANGSLSDENRGAIATEVRDLKQQMLALANTRGSRGYLFAGSQTDQPPFDTNGVFQGNDDEHTLQFGAGNPTRVSVSGASAFTTAGGLDVFATIDALDTALTSNDRAGASAAMETIEAARAQIVKEQTQAGLTLNRLDTSSAALEQLDVSLNRREQDVGAADPYETYSKLSKLSDALERAVTVSRQLLDLGKSNRF